MSKTHIHYNININRYHCFNVIFRSDKHSILIRVNETYKKVKKM